MIGKLTQALFENEPRGLRLPEEPLRQFDRDGVVHLHNLFLMHELEEIRHELQAAKLAMVPSEHLSDGFESWRGVTTISPNLAGLACDGRLVGAAVQLLGINIRLIGSQFIRRKRSDEPRQARTPEKPGWHRDIYGMARDLGAAAPRCAIKCAIALSDAPERKYGATRFVAGSQLTGLPAIKWGEIDPPGWIDFASHAGDVTIFENRTAHAGGINETDRPFEVLMLQYGYRWLSEVPRCQHNALLSDKVTNLARQILEPSDCDNENRYVVGSGAALIDEWARRQGLLKPNHFFSNTDADGCVVKV